MATGKCFFFKGDKYVRFDIATNRIDPGYPRRIAHDWPGMKEAGFDRDLDEAIYWSEWRLYFFKGDKFVLFDLRSNKVVEPAPVPIVSEGNWRRMQEAGFGGDIDAAVNWGSSGKLYFFKGDQFIRFDMPSNQMDGAASAPIHSPQNPNNWPGLNQDGFGSGIDAALNWGGGKLYFFKGDKFIRFDAPSNRAEGAPTPINSPGNWNGLADAGFASGIDAATRLGGDRPYQGPQPNPNPPEPEEIWAGKVDAKLETGSATGIKVKKGDVITITASGTAYRATGAASGPDGDEGYKPDGLLYQQAPVGSLVMQIGDQYFPVKSKLSNWTVPADGEITFFFNDKPRGFHDNKGGFDVNIQQVPAA